jgi:hypothetical protein
MARPWPDDCIQTCCRDWWIEDRAATLVRGRLLHTFVAFPDVKPYRLVPEDRGDDPKDHSRFRVRIEPFTAGSPPKPAPDSLPVAAMPLHPGENYVVQRGKTRPAVVVSQGGVDIPVGVRGGGARWQTSPRLIVAPYYGTDQGWDAGFVARIRHAEWPQYMWDQLPVGGVDESVLRLDQMFPMGRDDSSAFRLTDYRLGDDGLSVLDEWVRWTITGGLDPKGPLAGIRAMLMRVEGPEDSR